MLRTRFLPILLLLLLSTSAQAIYTPPPPKLSASGHFLVDMYSGRVLAQKNADQRLEPASLTKIMTAYVVFLALQQGAIDLTDQVTVSKKAWKMPGSRMFIEVDTQVSVADLLRGLVIQSGNDAAVALAEHVAGSETAFVEMMNQQAAVLGMHNSHFANAEGLSNPEHYTTPRDMVKVTEATIRDFPEYYKLYAEKSFTYNDIQQPNRNRLLWRDDAVDGVKTGHTQAAGYCLIASAEKDAMRLISVIMGAKNTKSRTQQSHALLNYGFRFYDTHQLHLSGEPILNTRIWHGETENLALGLAEDLYVTIPHDQREALQVRHEITPDNTAPIVQGQVLGNLFVELAGKEIRRMPLVALADMPEGNLWRKLVDTLQKIVE